MGLARSTFYDAPSASLAASEVLTQIGVVSPVVV